MYRSAIVVLLMSWGWMSCTKADIRFGDQFLDNGYTQIVKVDSFTVEMSTVLVDSFVTSAKGTTLVGGYQDPLFGRIGAQTYFEVTPPAYVDSFANTIFDSLVLVLKPNGGYYGDTTLPATIRVEQLAEAIAPRDNDLGLFYNTRSLNAYPSPLGSKTVLVRPNAGDSLVVRLSDALGRTLLQKMQNPTDVDIQTTEGFLQYFYGLRLSGTGSDRLVFGCADSAVMRLYYKLPGLYLQDKKLDFALVNNAHHFTHIQADRSGTPLKDLAALKQLPSSATGNASFSSYAGGAQAKIRFPSIRDVLKLPKYAKILSATLAIRPVRGSYGSPYALPPQLALSQTTQLNQLGNDLTVTNSDGSVTVQTGNLYVDALYGENTVYTYDVTAYLRGLLTQATLNNNGLLLVPPSPAMETRFNRIMAGDGKNAQSKTQLTILYATVQ